jgi:hypothetical protein
MNLKLNTTKLLMFFFAGSLLFLSSCKKDEEDKNIFSRATSEFGADVPYEWNELMLEIDRYSPGYRPPAAARMLAYTGLAFYEAVVPGMPEYNTLRSNFPGLILPTADPNMEYHWELAANTVYATMFRNFYPHIRTDHQARISAMEEKHNRRIEGQITREVYDRSVSFGRSVADAVYNWSRTDVAGHDAFREPRPSSYVPPTHDSNGNPLWQPTFPDFTPALFPYWGNVRQFAIREGDKIARPPIPYSEERDSRFYNEAKEIEIWVNQSTYEDRWMAEFWSDDIFELTFQPAARLVAIGNQLVKEDHISLARAAEMYAKLGMALCDTGIAIWNSKYLYNVMRPVQYIRDVINPDWQSILNNPINNVSGMSPEFPAYPSGHSGFGGAGMSILIDIFGNSRSFTDKCHQDRTEFLGTPRTYNNLGELGTENAYSRLPLGVHFRMDCDEGLRMGYLAARRVIELQWRK